MINYEFWIDITIILLLIPTIFYTATLSAKLSKAEQNQNKMAELTQALRHATEVYALQSEEQKEHDSQTKTSSTCAKTPHIDSLYNEPYFNQNVSTPSAQPTTEPNEPIASAYAPQSEKREEPSEAELELLQALKSIK